MMMKIKVIIIASKTLKELKGDIYILAFYIVIVSLVECFSENVKLRY